MIDPSSMPTSVILAYRAQTLREVATLALSYAHAEIELELYEAELARRPVRKADLKETV